MTTTNNHHVLLDTDSEDGCEEVHVKRDDGFEVIVLRQEGLNPLSKDTVVMSYSQAKDLCNAIFSLLEETKNVVPSSDD